MKLFDRSGGHWLFWWSAIYLAVGMYSIFVEKFVRFELIEFAWFCIIALPLTYNPLARWLNMKENTMFDWIKGKDKTPSNVVPFPEPKETPKVPYLVPPAPKPAPTTYYTFGLTNDNRVSFTIGYATLLMNDVGVDQLITQLEFYRDQLRAEQ